MVVYDMEVVVVEGSGGAAAAFYFFGISAAAAIATLFAALACVERLQWCAANSRGHCHIHHSDCCSLVLVCFAKRDKDSTER